MSKNEMIMLPREVVERALTSLESEFGKHSKSASDIRTALEQPQGEQEPYLYYDPANGDTWTQEAIADGFRQPDGLIALYTK